MPDKLLKMVDATAKKEHRKRSEFFKELALRYLAAKKKKTRFSEFADLELAAQSSFDFWDNPIDDETWNAT